MLKYRPCLFIWVRFGFFVFFFFFFTFYDFLAYFHWHTTSTKRKWNFPIRHCLVFILKYVFSYRFYTSHIPYLWCKRIYTSCRRLCNPKKTKYMTLGPKFYISVFCHHGYVLFCKSKFFSGMCRIFRDLAFGSIKTRFKSFWGIFSIICMRPWIRRYRFYWTFAPGGRLNYEAYNVDTKSNFRPQIWGV